MSRRWANSSPRAIRARWVAARFRCHGPRAALRPRTFAFSRRAFDTSMTYTVSGPGDVAVISKQPAGLGIIHLTLQVPANATPGARTLFIQNTNLDKTAASGVLEVN